MGSRTPKGTRQIFPPRLYVVRDSVGNTKNLIVVPTNIMKGLATALHIKFRCPSRKELENIMSRYWFSTSLAKTVQDVWEKCDTCQSLKAAPQEIFEQSTSKSGPVGTQWAADIIKSDRQLIFMAREKLSNFTVTEFISNKNADSIQQAIIGQLPRVSREDPERIRVDSVFETCVCSLSVCKQIFSFSLFQPSLFIQYSTEECSTVQVFIWCLDTIA